MLGGHGEADFAIGGGAARGAEIVQAQAVEAFGAEAARQVLDMVGQATILADQHNSGNLAAEGLAAGDQFGMGRLHQIAAQIGGRAGDGHRFDLDARVVDRGHRRGHRRRCGERRAAQKRLTNAGRRGRDHESAQKAPASYRPTLKLVADIVVALFHTCVLDLLCDLQFSLRGLDPARESGRPVQVRPRDRIAKQCCWMMAEPQGLAIGSARATGPMSPLEFPLPSPHS